jgi:hypothetical protein
VGICQFRHIREDMGLCLRPCKIIIMKLDIHFWVTAFGALSALFGGSVLFSDRFFSWMSKNAWVSSDIDKRSMSPEGIYKFNRYGRGGGAFLGGIILLAYSLQYYLSQ